MFLEIIKIFLIYSFFGE